MGYQNWTPIESDIPCQHCGEKGGLEVREWESSCGGYEDYQYRCTKCGRDWWVDGPDA